MSAPLPPGRVRPANPQPVYGVPTTQHHHGPELAGLTPPCCAPSAGQDTGQLRDEESVDLTPGVVWTDSQLVVLRQLTGTLHRARVERDEARAQVQRVRNIDPVEVALGGLAYVIDQMDQTVTEHHPGT